MSGPLRGASDRLATRPPRIVQGELAGSATGVTRGTMDKRFFMPEGLKPLRTNLSQY